MIFQREAHCATCHMTNGQGNGVVYPTLVGSPWVTGSEERLVKIALHGMWGKLTVRGKVYDPSRGVPPMTAFRDLLKDDEMAAVLTFVRNTWGNEASVITPETVAKVRKETSKRSVFWKPDDLLAEHPLEKELVAKGGGAEDVFSNLELEKELLAIPPAELAAIAMKEGNVRRGEKVFQRSSAACAACHDPPEGSPRLGPNLETLATKLTPEDHVNSILNPSLRIDKDFAQVKILTLDGDLVTGIRVSQNEDEIVLRNLVDSDPITIKMEDVDEMAEAKLSIMPANLVRQFKDKQEFYDLMRYVIKTRQR